VSEEGRPRTAEDAWVVLRSGGREPSGIEIPTKPSGVTSAHGPIRMALGSSGEARLLLPLGGAESSKGIVGAPSLSIETSIYKESGVPRRFLDLTCLSGELETVFAEVAEQILSRVEAGSSCLDATRSTIEEFRALLIRPPGTEVTLQMVAGLVGELLVLKRLLDRSAEAWRSWRGPAGDRHDFAKASTALEVKVTLRKGKTEVSINGLEQLAEPAGGRLFLQHFELEVAAAGLLSVSSLGRAAIENSSNPDEVRKLLSALGCLDVDDEAWNRSSFRLENEALYAVVEGFPRIVSASFPGSGLPAGLSKVCYVTDLAEAASFRVQPAEVAAVEEMMIP
jgi:hypothetical protein